MWLSAGFCGWCVVRRVGAPLTPYWCPTISGDRKQSLSPNHTPWTDGKIAQTAANKLTLNAVHGESGGWAAAQNRLSIWHLAGEFKNLRPNRWWIYLYLMRSRFAEPRAQSACHWRLHYRELTVRQQDSRIYYGPIEDKDTVAAALWCHLIMS